MEMAVLSPSDPGGVVQLEGTVGHQLRKSSQTSGGMSAPEIRQGTPGTVNPY